MALPAYALFQQSINRDANFKQLAQAKFPYPPASIVEKLDCDPFKEDLDFWDMLFGKKVKSVMKEENEIGEIKEYSKKPVPNQEDKGLFKGFKKLFGKKK